MGEGGSGEHQATTSLMPDSALGADKRIHTTKLKCVRCIDTPEGGHLVGILQPLWNKALESDMRLDWLRLMLRKDLVVRDIQHFGENVNKKLRTESSREEEMGREALIELMKVKLKDERRYHRECYKVRERIRNRLRSDLGRRKYDNLMEKMKRKLAKNKKILREKYHEKTKRLENARNLEEIRKRQEVQKD